MDTKHVSSIKMIHFQGKYMTTLNVNENNVSSEHGPLITDIS